MKLNTCSVVWKHTMHVLFRKLKQKSYWKFLLFQVTPNPQSYFDNNFKQLYKTDQQVINSMHVPNYLPPTPTPYPVPHDIGIGYFGVFTPFTSPEQKLAIVHFLNKLPLPHLSPYWFILLFILTPVILTILAILIYKFAPRIGNALFPLLASRFTKHDRAKSFLELTFPASTDKSAYATEQLYTLLHNLSRRRKGWFQSSYQYSFEIVATKEEIRYVLSVPSKDVEVIHRSLLSYLPGIKVRDIPDYLINTNFFDAILNKQEKSNPKTDENEQSTAEAEKIYRTGGVVELTLANDFVLPLKSQKVLTEHDPMSFLTGQMTKLNNGEMIAYQIIATPTLKSKTLGKIQQVKNAMYNNKPLAPIVSKRKMISIDLPSPLFLILSPLLWLAILAGGFLLFCFKTLPYLIFSPNGEVSKDFFNSKPKVEDMLILQNPYEQDLKTIVKEKLSTHLFETTIRLFILTNDDSEYERRESGLTGAFEQFRTEHQWFKVQPFTRLPYLSIRSFKKRLSDFRSRTLSNRTTVLSASEISDLYHFSHAASSRIEGLTKLHSTELPASPSLKKSTAYDIVIGKNTYGGQETLIGVTEEKREKHMVLFGGTGNGKSTLYHSMIVQDMIAGRGVLVIDPHGDLSQWVLSCVPVQRKQDLVYINADDIESPVALNILETTKELTETEAVKEKQYVVDGVISLFRRIFADDALLGHAHRIENTLRNAIYTLFLVPDRTLANIYDFLEDSEYRNKVLKLLTDKRLKKFWRNLDKKAGDYQEFKLVSPVTARINQFIRSPFTASMVEQEHSTIDFTKLMDEKKIVICNLSRGILGEETAETIGMMLLTKLQLAAMRRAKQKEEDRIPFYVYIDEFQYFATKSFVEMITSLRKYKVYLHIALQSTAQLFDPKIADIFLANVGIIGTFRSASPHDEELILPQFTPYVKKGEILNLPEHHFYMKISATVPEEPFSGVTIKTEVTNNSEYIAEIIQLSRDKYGVKKAHEDVKDKKKTKKDMKVKNPKKESFRNTNGHITTNRTQTPVVPTSNEHSTKKSQRTNGTKQNGLVKQPIQADTIAVDAP